MKCYHLKTSRVSGTNDDSTSKIETITVKLVTEAALVKFCKFILVNGYVKAMPPKIVKVLDVTRGQNEKDISKKETSTAQAIVDDLLKDTSMVKDVDYKAEAEAQRKRNDQLESRLKALEKAKEPKPEEKKAETPRTPKQVKTN